CPGPRPRCRGGRRSPAARSGDASRNASRPTAWRAIISRSIGAYCATAFLRMSPSCRRFTRWAFPPRGASKQRGSCVMAEAMTPASEDEAQYRIEATGGFREPRTRILKPGDTLSVFNAFGDMVGGAGSPDGLYHEDTRYLSQLELSLNGDRPLLLSA